MPPGTRTIKSELYNWLEDYASEDLLDKCAKAIEEVVKENSEVAATDKKGSNLGDSEVTP